MVTSSDFQTTIGGVIFLLFLCFVTEYCTGLFNHEDSDDIHGDRYKHKLMLTCTLTEQSGRY